MFTSFGQPLLHLSFRLFLGLIKSLPRHQCECRKTTLVLHPGQWQYDYNKYNSIVVDRARGVCGSGSGSGSAI